jgi:hypothetical protein
MINSDTATRAQETIDSPPGSLKLTERFGISLACSKVRQTHCDRLAIVYVRQSTPQQVFENRESRSRQYALADFETV